jgi:hypothetical protein
MLRQELLFTSAGRQFRAVLTRPEHAPHPLAAVVVCPGRNAVVDQVTGAVPPDYPDRAVAAQFAAAGFVSLTLDYGLAGAVDPARLYGRDEAAVLAHLHAAAGRPLLGALASGAAAVVGWLGHHPAVLPGQVGLFGHSLGGAVALHADLVLDPPVPLCTASHLGSYRILAYGHPALLLPGIARHADLPDLYAALAPPLACPAAMAPGSPKRSASSAGRSLARPGRLRRLRLASRRFGSASTPGCARRSPISSMRPSSRGRSPSARL